MNIVALYGSSRRGGNSELLADRILSGLDCRRIYLVDKHVQAINDQRHTPTGFQPVADDYDSIIQEVLAADVVLFVTPLYWYGMSGLMKDFIDRWSQSLRDKRFDFKGALSAKRAYVVVTGSDQPRLKALPLIQQFAYIFGFFGMNFAGYVIGQGNKPGEVLQDEAALRQAEQIHRELGLDTHK